MDYTVHRMLQARILELSSLSFLQGIFPNQGSNPHLPHCRWIPAEPQGKPLVSKKSCTGHGSGRPAGRSLNSVWMEQNQGTPCSSLLPLPSTSFPATNLKTIFSAHLCLWDQLTPFFFYFLGLLDLCCCWRAFSSCEQGQLFIAVASLAAEHKLWGVWAPVVAALGL